MIRRIRSRQPTHGQALVEFALVVPIFLLVVVGIIVLGIGVFYNQQLTNAAREAARFSSVHSASAQCPVVSSLNPVNIFGYTSTDSGTGHTASYAAPPSYLRCDANPWPQMTTHARSKVFGLNAASVIFSACWSGYRTATQYDAPPTGVAFSAWSQCTIGGFDPTTQSRSIACTNGLGTHDTASDISEGQGRYPANRVTAYACYAWTPPMAGFLLIPQTVTFRAVISEPIQRQQ